MPRFIYISKTDEDNSDYNATFNALRENYGSRFAPLVVPIWDENKKVTGIIDVLNKRAYRDAERQARGDRHSRGQGAASSPSSTTP